MDNKDEPFPDYGDDIPPDYVDSDKDEQETRFTSGKTSDSNQVVHAVVHHTHDDDEKRHATLEADYDSNEDKCEMNADEVDAKDISKKYNDNDTESFRSIPLSRQPSHFSITSLDFRSLRLKGFKQKQRQALPMVVNKMMQERRREQQAAKKPAVNLKDALLQLQKQQREDKEEKTEPRELSSYKRWKYKQQMKWKRWKHDVKEFWSDFEIWRGSFKVIDGNFGSSVVAYFRFVKWLFLLNLLTALLILGAVVLPQAFLQPTLFADTLPDNTSYLNFYEETAMECTEDYLEDLDTSYRNRNKTWFISEDDVLDLLHGTGWMEHTLLFMGYYFDKVYLYSGQSVKFMMPLAYLLVPMAYMLFTLGKMVDITSTGVRERVVSPGDKFYQACNKVFCGWDFSLSDNTAAYYKHKNIYLEYKHDYEEEQYQLKKEHRTDCETFGIYLIRALIWLFTLAIWGGSIYLIFMVVGEWMPKLLEDETVKGNSGLVLVVEFLPSLTMTAIAVIFPPIFAIIVRVEDYTPEVELLITMIRMVVLRFLAIGVLMLTLYARLICDSDDRNCGVCEDFPSRCWETYIGQELYKLAILDFVVVVATTFLMEFPRKFLVEKCYSSRLAQLVGYEEFDIPYNVLMIVYSQTICWLGGFFSPLIPAITAIKFFIFFYCKKVSLMYNFVPSLKQYRASRSNYFFMVILMVSFILCAIFLALCIGMIPPSQGCGPFRVYAEEQFYMAHTIKTAVDGTPDWLRVIFYLLWNRGIHIILVMCVCLSIAYFHAMGKGHSENVKMLEAELAMISADKQFLLNQVNDVLQQSEPTDGINRPDKEGESAEDRSDINSKHGDNNRSLHDGE